VLSIKITVSWNVMMCSSVDRYSDLLYCCINDTEQDCVTTKILNCCVVTHNCLPCNTNEYMAEKSYINCSLSKKANITDIRS
jgi:hypothetical protein